MGMGMGGGCLMCRGGVGVRVGWDAAVRRLVRTRVTVGKIRTYGVNLCKAVDNYQQTKHFSIDS